MLRVVRPPFIRFTLDCMRYRNYLLFVLFVRVHKGLGLVPVIS